MFLVFGSAFLSKFPKKSTFLAKNGKKMGIFGSVSVAPILTREYEGHSTLREHPFHTYISLVVSKIYLSKNNSYVYNPPIFWISYKNACAMVNDYYLPKSKEAHWISIHSPPANTPTICAHNCLSLDWVGSMTSEATMTSVLLSSLAEIIQKRHK